MIRKDNNLFFVSSTFSTKLATNAFQMYSTATKPDVYSFTLTLIADPSSQATLIVGNYSGSFDSHRV